MQVVLRTGSTVCLKVMKNVREPSVWKSRGI